MTISMFGLQLEREGIEDAQRPEVGRQQEKLGDSVLNTASGMAVGAITSSPEAGAVAGAIASEVVKRAPSGVKRAAFAVGNGLTLGLLASVARCRASDAGGDE